MFSKGNQILLKTDHKLFKSSILYFLILQMGEIALRPPLPLRYAPLIPGWDKTDHSPFLLEGGTSRGGSLCPAHIALYWSLISRCYQTLRPMGKQNSGGNGRHSAVWYHIIWRHIDRVGPGGINPGERRRWIKIREIGSKWCLTSGPARHGSGRLGRHTGPGEGDKTPPPNTGGLVGSRSWDTVPEIARVRNPLNGHTEQTDKQTNGVSSR